ncbi:unnamed protein product [Gongylonema pulchrum]|uniref:Anoctamin n=1 Tax=Gongylonema pulchrum TaxID=637853 RepID=A0A183DZ70_9BILA|nr:unnamed protein product [Gongylonema pulchrum]
MIASLFSYERVTLEDYPLPLRYELVAWLTMVGPLLVVPFAALSTLYDAWRNHMPLLSVFDCSRWRHKHVGGGDTLEPKHATNEDHDYWVYNFYAFLHSVLHQRCKKKRFKTRPSWTFLKEISSCSTSSDNRNFVKLSLFGGPPTVERLEKTNTVIYRPSRGGESRKASQLSSLSSSGKYRPSRYIRANSACQSTSFGKPPPCVLPCTEQGLHLRQTMDCQSESSISITPTGSVQSYSSGFMVNNGTTGSSSANDRHQLPVLRRPGPVKTPPPFNQL